MKKAGQVVVFRFPQTDLAEGKLRGTVFFVQEIPKTIGRKKISHRRHLNEILYDACFPLFSLNKRLRERLLPLAQFQREAGFFPQIS
jgi:hypothetical protein